MKKGGGKSKILSISPKLGQKKGQFYLLTTIIIITILAGLITISNYSRERSNVKFDYLADELEIESEKVLDYGIKNNKDLKVLLGDFTRDYSDYSETENSYFIFGDEDEITVTGYKKLNSGAIFIDAGSGNQTLTLSKGEYNSIDFSNPTESIKITVDGIEYNFILKSGENLYFIISKEINEEKYIFTN